MSQHLTKPKAVAALKNVLESLSTIPEPEWLRLQNIILEAQEVPENHVCLNVGDPARYMYFIAKGLMKAFYTTAKGDEFVRDFLTEGTFAGAFSSALLRRPSNVSIIALEPSLLLRFDYFAFTEFYDHHSCWQEISRKIAEHYYLRREERQIQLMTMTANERLEAFKAEQGHLVTRIKKRDMASYLSVRPETVSRLLK